MCFDKIEFLKGVFLVSTNSLLNMHITIRKKDVDQFEAEKPDTCAVKQM